MTPPLRSVDEVALELCHQQYLHAPGVVCDACERRAAAIRADKLAVLDEYERIVRWNDEGLFTREAVIYLLNKLRREIEGGGR